MSFHEVMRTLFRLSARFHDHHQGHGFHRRASARCAYSNHEMEEAFLVAGEICTCFYIYVNINAMHIYIYL